MARGQGFKKGARWTAQFKSFACGCFRPSIRDDEGTSGTVATTDLSAKVDNESCKLGAQDLCNGSDIQSDSQLIKASADDCETACALEDTNPATDGSSNDPDVLVDDRVSCVATSVDDRTSTSTSSDDERVVLVETHTPADLPMVHEPHAVDSLEAVSEEPQVVDSLEAVSEEPQSVDSLVAVSEEPQVVDSLEAVTEEPQSVDSLKAVSEEPQVVGTLEAVSVEPQAGDSFEGVSDELRVVDSLQAASDELQAVETTDEARITPEATTLAAAGSSMIVAPVSPLSVGCSTGMAPAASSPAADVPAVARPLEDDLEYEVEGSQTALKLESGLVVLTESQVAGFEFVSRGGCGSITRGYVRLSESDEQPTMVACKTKVQLGWLKRELSMWQCMDHPNIVQLLGVIVSDDNPKLVVGFFMEHMDGNAYEYYSSAEGNLSMLELLTMILSAARGLLDMHEYGILHLDMKSLNFLFKRLLDGKRVWKICDFGGARAAGLLETAWPGTEHCRAPELVKCDNLLFPRRGLQSARLDGRTDVYALGCLMFEAANKEQAWADVGPKTLAEVKFCDQLPLPDRLPHVTDAYWALLVRCLEANPVNRPDIEEVVEELQRQITEQEQDTGDVA